MKIKTVFSIMLVFFALLAMPLGCTDSSKTPQSNAETEVSKQGPSASADTSQIAILPETEEENKPTTPEAQGIVASEKPVPSNEPPTSKANIEKGKAVSPKKSTTATHPTEAKKTETSKSSTTLAETETSKLAEQPKEEAKPAPAPATANKETEKVPSFKPETEAKPAEPTPEKPKAPVETKPSQQPQTNDWPVPAKYANMANPVKADNESLKIGKSLWGKHCTSCHGKSGLGDGSKAAQLDTPSGDFTTAAFQSQTDGALFYKTVEGRDDMPSYKKKIPYEEDIWHLVNFMRTLK